MNKVAAFALRRKNSILSMSEKMFCPPQPLRFWITPAYAGKRRSDWIIRSIYWDHPRVCGEKLSTTSTDIHPAGSPPRMRGKGVSLSGHISVKRITPAYAGKSSAAAAARICARDHPRICGEKTSFQTACRVRCGSPPHVRGKVGDGPRDEFSVRITPACAGKR